MCKITEKECSITAQSHRIIDQKSQPLIDGTVLINHEDIDVSRSADIQTKNTYQSTKADRFTHVMVFAQKTKTMPYYGGLVPPSDCLKTS